jgi:hypothetical protein
VSDFDDAITETTSSASDHPLEQAVREIHTETAGDKKKRANPYDPNRETIGQPLGDLAEHAVSSGYHAVIGGYQGLLDLARGKGVDTAAQDVEGEQSKVKPIPEKSQRVLDHATNFTHAFLPATQLPGMVQPAADTVADKSADWGAPPSVSAAIKSAPTALSLAGPLSGAFRGVAAPAALETAEAGALAAPKMPTSTEMAVVPSRGTAIARAPGSALPAENVIDVQATPVDSAAGPRVGGPQQPRLGQSATTQTATAVPGIAPAPEPQKLLTFQPDAPHVEQGERLPVDEQQRRADVLKRVGVEQVRKSALTGDAQAAADEYQSSLLNTPGGQHLNSVITHERQALGNHADNIVTETGGTEGSATNQTVNTQRGENFLKPLDALSDHFDTVRKELYKTADERANGQSIDLPSVDHLIRNNESAFIGSTAGTQLLKGLKARMTELGLVDDNGAMVGGTAQQAEQLRQYLNEQWEPGPKSRLIGKLKDAIDTDVTKSAGDDIYEKARQWRTLQARTLEDPKGIAQLLDSSGPDGVNRKVPVEGIMNKLSSMPVAQLKHIVTTLDGIDVPEIRPLADKAVAELNAHMASQVSDAGHSTASLWNQKGVNKYLNANSERLQLTMPKELQSKLTDLNDAGHILQKRQGYPGAYIQEQNLASKGLGGALRYGSEVAGHAMGPAVGLVGRVLGDRAAGGIEGAASLRAARQRTVRLSDFDPNEK